MWSAMQRLGAACLWACACAEASEFDAQEAPPQVVSTSLCADQYLDALYSEGLFDVRATSWQSDDAMAGLSEGFATGQKAWADAERLIALAPDLVVFGPGEGGATRARLEQFGIETIEIAYGDGAPTVAQNVATLRNWDLDMHDQVFVVPPWDVAHAPVTEVSDPRVLYLTPSLGTAGTDTFIDEIMRSASVYNAAAQAGITGWGRLTVEDLRVMDVDIVWLGFFSDGYRNAHAPGADWQRHVKGGDDLPVFEVPSGWLVCANPKMFDAAYALRDFADAWAVAREGR